MSYEKQGTAHDPHAAGYELQGRDKAPSPSEMEVVANLRSDAAQLLRMSKATAFGEDLSVRVAKPDLLIANMVAAADTVEALSAQVLRLTEEKEALRKALKRIADMTGTAGMEAGPLCKWTENGVTTMRPSGIGNFANDIARAALSQGGTDES